mmetsp:Transcript_6094/g.17063  ORF Transcript_6094/g.17063 Transcript_6094/m.17063 type:complete len:638 (+) Transcript_6094:162-2075(+)
MASSSATDLPDRALVWAASDPNRTTANYVIDLASKSDDEEAKATLLALFPADTSRRIGFGTAGLRSAMKPGPLHMNDLVIVQTTQGLARHVQVVWEQHKSSGEGRRSKDAKPLAVVGFDHRCEPKFGLSSRRFAMLTKLVFLEAGFDCIMLDSSKDFVHTPLVAFATLNLKAMVGVMVTASHNPKQDNGYKVYWNDGVQIRPPIDGDVALSIVAEENLRPWTDYSTTLDKQREESPRDDLCFGLSDEKTTMKLVDAYYECISSSGLVIGQAKLLEEGGWHPPSIAYSAMHGVGNQWATKLFSTCGLRPFKSVPAQKRPDPAFPTVPFPNPEERGALALSQSFSELEGCDIIVANDPDADRLACAERSREDGSWTTFTGDQIGTMLGHWLYTQVGKPSSDEKKIAMVASTVSSSMLSVIAKREGFYFEDTLTGFKWIGSKAVDLNSSGYRTLFGYEEAIGFAFPDIVPDKDGITSLGILSELAYHVYHEGKTLKEHMQGLYKKYGEFVSNNSYYFCHDPKVALKIFDDFKRDGYPSLVAGYEIESIRYLGEPGYDSLAADKKPTLATSKSSPMLTLRFKNGCVVQLRASGTEPKFKYYIEMRGEPGVSRDEVEKELMKMSRLVLEEICQPENNGLVVP